MRFLFTSIRGQGHTRPLLPFAKGLQARGHEVCIASPEDTRAIAEKAGLELIPFDRMSDEEIQTYWAGRQRSTGEELVKIGVQEMFANRTARRAMPKLEAAIEAWRPDVVIREAAEYAAFALCEKHGIPHARVAVHNGEVEAKLLRFAQDPIDNILVDVGASAQSGAGLWAEGPGSRQRGSSRD